MHGGKGNGGKINLTIRFNYENYCSIMGISMIFMLLGMMVQFRQKSKFAIYRKVATSSGLNGKEIAEKMLRDNGIYDLQVTSVSGLLSDHYDPTKKTTNLSEEVYERTNVSAAVVAAHECGHEVQHATDYSMLTFKEQKLAPTSLNGLFWQD